MVEEDVRNFKTEAPSTQFTKFELQKHIKFDQESQDTICDTFEELRQNTSKTTSPFPYSM
jgi:hypothetical protein